MDKIEFFSTFVLICVGCLWFIIEGILFVKTMDAAYLSGKVLFGTAAIIWLALPISLLASIDGPPDPNADRLCLHGHEEWKITQHPPMFSGKVIIPARTTREKVWVCDKWEN
jgi:hypothetical protein